MWVFFAGKIIFGRSHVRDVALRRKEPISEYCKVGQIMFKALNSLCLQESLQVWSDPALILLHKKLIFLGQAWIINLL